MWTLIVGVLFIIIITPLYHQKLWLFNGMLACLCPFTAVSDFPNVLISVIFIFLILLFFPFSPDLFFNGAAVTWEMLKLHVF